MRLWNEPVSQLSPTHLLCCWDRPPMIPSWGFGGDWCSPYPLTLPASVLAVGSLITSKFCWLLTSRKRWKPCFSSYFLYPEKLCQRDVCVCDNFLPILAFSALPRGDSEWVPKKTISAKARQAPVKQGKIGQLPIFLLVKIFYTSIRDVSLCTCK